MSECLRIGIGIGSGDAFWVQVNDAIYRRGSQHHVEFIPISHSSFFSAFTVDEQNALLEEIASQELDVLLGWSFPESLAYHVLDSGTPIVHLFETVVKHPLCVSPLGLQEIAENLAHYLAGILHNRGNVLVIGGVLRDELPDDGRSRLLGVQNAFNSYPELRFCHIPTDWDNERAETQICAGLAEWPHAIDAIYGFSDSLALLGQHVVLEQGRCTSHTPIVGINGDPHSLAAIIEGRMTATVETSAVSLANQAFDIGVKIATGQPYPNHYKYNPRLITASNVAKVASEKLVAIAQMPMQLVNFERSAQQEYQAYLETSLDINRQIGSVLDYQSLPVELARLIRTNYAYDHVQLFYWSERDQTLTLMAHAEDQRPAKRIPLLDDRVLSEALIGDRAIFIPDSQRSIRYIPDPNWPDTRSRVVLPVRQGGKVLGLLDLHAFRVIQCTRQHLLGLQSLADQIGVAIGNAQLYAEALQARLIAEKADHLKSRLLANVSHELRSPLHIILSSVDRLNVMVASQDELQQIQKNAQHLLRLINDLVDLSRAEIDELSITPEIIEPVGFLTDVFESMAEHRTGEDHVTWELHLPAQLPVIQADPDRLRQIVLNLLGNARKFTSTGTIRLGADVTPPYLHFWVEDTGVGIPTQQQSQIFEPFVTLPGNSKRKDGVGLGLSIARRLVALHGGLMTLDSRIDKGSVFHVYMPIVNQGNTPIIPIHEVKPFLLAVSSRSTLSPDLMNYCQHQGLEFRQVCSHVEVDAVLSEGLPMAIAWDADIANDAEWQILQRLRSIARLCLLPFLLYGPISDHANGSRVTSIVMKPVKPDTLFEMVSGTMDPGDTETGPILVVDDDPDALAVYEHLVSERFPGYTCHTAKNGQDAITIMQTCTPRLVILDLVMPQMDGFEVVAWMRANRSTQHVPIAIISGKMLTLEDIRRLEPYQRITLQTKDVLSDTELMTVLQQILLDYQGLPPHTSAVVKQTVAYIHQHYEHPLSRTAIAQSVGVSENYLTQIFHQELGVSLWDYLNRYRVLQAKELLRQTHNSIAFISSQVGFDDPAYFSRVFRRYVGQTPRMYRNTVE